MKDHSKTIIGIIPNIRGVGGPASFNEKLEIGLTKLGVEVTYDLARTDISSVLVIAGTRHLGVLSNIKKRGIPIIQRLDGMNWVHRKTFTGLRHYLRSEVNNWILREIRAKYADRIIYQSKFSWDWWNRVYGELSIPESVIYNGVDLVRYAPAKTRITNSQFLNAIVVEGHIKNGLELGLKNVIQGLNAFTTKSQKKVQLFVAGEVPLDIRKKISEGVKIEIIWSGVISREQIAVQLRQADAFFSAELNPPCPNSVIEALASGLPVASFDSGAIRELVSKTSGIIAPYGGDIWNLDDAEPERLANYLVENLDALPEMGKKARLRAERMFGLDRMTRKYLDVLTG
jgi:glycosyltransferase involved in cell wall biosynthesis